MNYFTFYDLPVSFFVDESELKKRYYDKMRTLHPDMHMSAPVEVKNEILQQSSYNNKAYKTLKDFDLRIQYYLSLFIDPDAPKLTLPPSFLMEMMDTNDEIMELQMDQSSTKAFEVRQGLLTRQETSKNIVVTMLQNEQEVDNPTDDETLLKIQQYLLERNYLKRLISTVEKIISSY